MATVWNVPSKACYITKVIKGFAVSEWSHKPKGCQKWHSRCSVGIELPSVHTDFIESSWPILPQCEVVLPTRPRIINKNQTDG